MKNWILVLLVAASVGCGGSKTEVKDDTTLTEEKPMEEPKEEEQAPTVEPMATSADASGMIPAPSTVAAAPANAETSDSGLAWVVLEPGDGAGSPTLESSVTAHYTGWTTDGQMFDSSVARGEPFTAPLNKLIAGWQEGIALMSRGEKRRFWIPEALAYQGREGAPQGMLVFDVHLIDFQ